MIKYQFTKNTEDRRVCYIALFNNQQNPNHEKFCRTNDPAPFLNNKGRKEKEIHLGNNQPGKIK